MITRTTRLAATALAIALTLGLTSPTFAASTVPQTFGYAGTLVGTAGTPITTPHTFRFSLWQSGDFATDDVTDGTLNMAATNFSGYVETQTITPTAKGSFYVEIGASTPLPALRLPAHTYLQVEVKPAGSSDSTYTLLDPDEDLSSPLDRKPLAASPYALNARTLDSVEIGTEEGNLATLGKNGKWTGAQIPGGTNENTFRLDADNSGGDTQLSFTASKAIRYDVVNEKFIINGTAVIEGNLGVRSDLFVDGLINGRDIAADSATLETAVATVADIQTALMEKQAAIDSLTAALADVSTTAAVSALQAELTLAREEQATLSTQLTAAEDALAAVQAELQATKTTIDALTTRLATTESQAGTTSTKLATLETELVAAQTALAAATAERDALRTSDVAQADALTKLETQITELAAAKAGLTQAIAVNETRLATLERAEGNLTSQLASLQAEFAARVGTLEAAAHAPNTDTGTSATTFTLNAGNAGGDVTLSFGAALQKYLRYNTEKQRFEMNDGLSIDDNLAVTGNVFVDGAINGRDIDADGTALDGLKADVATLKATTQQVQAAATTMLTWNFIPKGETGKKVKSGEAGSATGYVMTRSGRITAVGISGNPEDKQANGTFFITKNDDGAYSPASVMTNLSLTKSGTGDANNSAFTASPTVGVAGVTFQAGDVIRIWHSDRDQWGSRATIEIQYQ